MIDYGDDLLVVVVDVVHVVGMKVIVCVCLMLFIVGLDKISFGGGIFYNLCMVVIFECVIEQMFGMDDWYIGWGSHFRFLDW